MKISWFRTFSMPAKKKLLRGLKDKNLNVLKCVVENRQKEIVKDWNLDKQDKDQQSLWE